MDVLSDTLRVVRLSGAVFLNANLTSPWAFESASPGEMAGYLRLPSDCIALFHIAVRGGGWFAVPGYAPVLLQAGDAILLPHSSPHIMSSELGMQNPMPMLAALPPLPYDGIARVTGGGAGEMTQFVCGYLHCDQRFNPLIGALPELIIVHPYDERQDVGVSRKDTAAPPMVLPVQRGDWLETTLHHTVEEAQGERPGNSDMMARLSEILFFEVVRRYMQQLPAAHPGWLAGVRDPVVGQVLRLIHSRPEQAWTVESLAQAVAVSRSSLAQRFTALVGESPMHYLAAWRIQLAKDLLKHSDANLVEIARRVGYDSDVAFNHAFRRYVGQPPATWRLATAEN